ncbi:hypothetical protein Bca4012_088645 [Brassica carinata]|uniref:Uncharacterized protein n=2 Tax=Brassica oleracea TaxID=3712 RepID=A0A0D3A7T1_BRAOL|nr:unnamed protein product [Brassica oleracea]
MEKMWYKLPYEDILDKKPLFDNVEENKRKTNAIIPDLTSLGCLFFVFRCLLWSSDMTF